MPNGCQACCAVVLLPPLDLIQTQPLCLLRIRENVAHNGQQGAIAAGVCALPACCAAKTRVSTILFWRRTFRRPLCPERRCHHGNQSFF